MENNSIVQQNISFKTTKRALILTSIFSEPLQVLFWTFISVILYRDLHASAPQLAVFNMLRPLVAILSLYWSFLIARYSRCNLSNILITGVLARIPFFFFPFIDNPWLIIACSASYMMLSRGGFPAWMEIVKQNLPQEKTRSTIFSYSSAFGYLEGTFLGIGLGMILDNSNQSWRWLFPMAASIGFIGLIFQSMIPRKIQHIKFSSSFDAKTLFSPWKTTKELLDRRPDFRSYQWGFMLAGVGLMIMQPSLPIFFVDYLHITYTDLAIALAVCKGIGFAIGSPFWNHLLHRFSIFRCAGYVFLSCTIFPILLFTTIYHPFYLYLAYLCYGFGQAGSHLIWHLSGTIFAKEEDSAPFSNVNVLTVGVRGGIAPALGSFIALSFGPLSAFICTSLFCFFAAQSMFKSFTKVTNKSPATNSN